MQITSKLQGKINKIIPFSAVDGPGNRTVIFFQNCDFNCSYCHNPETIEYCNSCGVCIDYCKSNALALLNDSIQWNSKECIQCDNCINACPKNSSPKIYNYSVDQIFKSIKNNLPFISGITISGGECTLQYNFLVDLLISAKQKNISVYIDTNASLAFSKMQELSKHFDKAMIDIKAYSDHEHKAITGRSNSLILQNAKYLLERDKVYEIRTVISDGLDNYNTVSKVSKLISTIDKSIRYKLIKYRNNGVRPNNTFKSPTNKQMSEFEQIAIKNELHNVIIV